MKKLFFSFLLLSLFSNAYSATMPIVAGKTTGASFSTGSTRYFPLGSFIPNGITDETLAQITVRDAYTLSNLYVRVIGNAATSDSTVRSRKNTANGAQSVTITALTTGIFRDTSNSDSLVNGDLINSQVINGGGGVLSLTAVGYTLTGSSWIYSTIGSVGISSTSNCSINGEVRFSGTESTKQYTVRSPQTLSNMQVILSVNTRTANSTCYFRKNTGNGNQNVVFATLQTGKLEDTTNTDSVAVGDVINYQFTFAAGTGSITATSFFTKTSFKGSYFIAGGNLATATTIAAGTTANMTVSGNPYETNSTEAQTQIAAQAEFAAKNMFVNVRSNTLDAGTTTVFLRKDSANSALGGNIAIGFGETGTYEDTASREFIASADLLNWQVIVSGTTGAIGLDFIGCELVPYSITKFNNARVNNMSVK